MSWIEIQLGVSAMDSSIGVFSKIHKCRAIQPALVPLPDGQGVNSSDYCSVEWIMQREGAGEEVANAVTRIDRNVSVSVAPTKNVDGDDGWPIFRRLDQTNRRHAVPQNTRPTRVSRLRSMEYRPSSDWMGRL